MLAAAGGYSQGVRALLAGFLLLLLSAQLAAAATWGLDVKLSSTLTHDHELERTGADSAIAVWLRGSTLIARRTTDGGKTWLPSQTLATGAGLWGSTWSSTIRISQAPSAGLDPEPAGLALLAVDALAGHAETGNTEGLWIREGSR